MTGTLRDKLLIGLFLSTMAVLLTGALAICVWFLLVLPVFRFLRVPCRIAYRLWRPPAPAEPPATPDDYRAERIIGYGVSILAVQRDGPDVLVRLGNVGELLSRLQLRDLAWIRFEATVRFSDCRRITSQYDHLLMPPERSRELRLEPGWGLDQLDFDGIVATMAASYSVPAPFEQRDTYAVLHRIYCDGVRMTRRFSLSYTLLALLFPGSHHDVEREPVHSPPIAGQDQEAFGGTRT